MEMLRSQLQHLQLNNDTPVFFFFFFFFFFLFIFFFFFFFFFFFEKGFYFSEKRI